MNDTLKFRAWDRNPLDSYRMKYNLHLNSAYFQQPTLNGIVVMQFTGLKDKNGKEIYEGDLVIYQETTYQIKYIPTKACYSLVGISKFSDILAAIYDYVFTELTTVKYFEIIGNIYENPELLNQQP